MIDRAPTAEGHWLRALSGSGDIGPASPASYLQAAAGLIGEGAVAWAIDVGAEMARKVSERIPAYQKSGVVEVLRTGTESTTIAALVHLYGNTTGFPLSTAQALSGDREFVRRGIPLEDVLRGIRMSHALLMRSLLQESARILIEPNRAQEMERISEVLFEYIDTFSITMAQEYGQERERWLSSGAAARAELVRTILEEHNEISVDDATAGLSYPLGAHHVAAVLWRDTSRPAEEELTMTAARLCAGIGAAGTLTVADGSNTVWIWTAHRSAPPAQGGFSVPSSSGLHLSVSAPAAGLAGFRRGHREALAASSVRQATTPMSLRSVPTLTFYPEVEVSVLAGQDLPLARGLVQRELGELAADSESAAEMRLTLTTYLATNRSLAHSAEALHVARNTVAYRIKKVEALLGRDLTERRLELELALRLVSQLGRAVLVRP